MRQFVLFLVLLFHCLLKHLRCFLHALLNGKRVHAAQQSIGMSAKDDS